MGAPAYACPAKAREGERRAHASGRMNYLNDDPHGVPKVGRTVLGQIREVAVSKPCEEPCLLIVLRVHVSAGTPQELSLWDVGHEPA